MNANELITVARLADHYEKHLTDGQDPLEVATHDFNKLKREAPKLLSFLRASDHSDRRLGDWLYAFIERYKESGMSLKNFAAVDLERLEASRDAPTKKAPAARDKSARMKGLGHSMMVKKTVRTKRSPEWLRGERHGARAAAENVLKHGRSFAQLALRDLQANVRRGEDIEDFDRGYVQAYAATLKESRDVLQALGRPLTKAELDRDIQEALARRR